MHRILVLLAAAVCVRAGTIQGVVLEVKDYHCPVSGTIGTHFSLKTDHGDLEVHMAPAKFFKDYEILIRKGADVSVTGNRVELVPVNPSCATGSKRSL